ncbi:MULTISPECIES: helix-turn-helix transcriptional regulator [Niastella]|uniref:Helix-turn-helix transcriptional regulator n=1 Tax=Niastella soli TaxID=2821487 RepID=A0ABS3Z361_9BACT|nr:AraC family transcriptional regulator [Niastella soli]MBO9204608.1 helix-turn-helix transcriptional regulator [Niastella soli]
MRNERPVSPHVADAVRIIKQYIEQHPLERIPIPNLIAKVTIGKNLLHESFRQLEGKTIIRFQLEKRMEKASSLLEEGRLSVSQIACKCGYREQANFTSDFKKIFNLTPKEKVSQTLDSVYF